MEASVCGQKSGAATRRSYLRSMGALAASKPMPASAQWDEVNKAVTGNLAKVRAGEVSVNQGLAAIDQGVMAAVQKR